MVAFVSGGAMATSPRPRRILPLSYQGRAGRDRIVGVGWPQLVLGEMDTTLKESVVEERLPAFRMRGVPATLVAPVSRLPTVIWRR